MFVIFVWEIYWLVYIYSTSMHYPLSRGYYIFYIPWYIYQWFIIPSKNCSSTY